MRLAIMFTSSLQMLFVLINTDVDDNARITEFFAITKDDIPTMRIITLAEDMKKFMPESKEMTKEAIKTFVQDFHDGKLKVRTRASLVTADNASFFVGSMYDFAKLLVNLHSWYPPFHGSVCDFRWCPPINRFKSTT